MSDMIPMSTKDRGEWTHDQWEYLVGSFYEDELGNLRLDDWDGDHTCVPPAVYEAALAFMAGLR